MKRKGKPAPPPTPFQLAALAKQAKSDQAKKVLRDKTLEWLEVEWQSAISRCFSARWFAENRKDYSGRSTYDEAAWALADELRTYAFDVWEVLREARTASKLALPPPPGDTAAHER